MSLPTDDQETESSRRLSAWWAGSFPPCDSAIPACGGWAAVARPGIIAHYRTSPGRMPFVMPASPSTPAAPPAPLRSERTAGPRIQLAAPTAAR